VELSVRIYNNQAMKRTLFILILALFAFQVEGQIIRAHPFARAQVSASRTFEQIIADGNTIGYYVAHVDNVSLEADSVVQWNDLSGSGNHLVQTLSLRKPLWDGTNVEIDFNPDAGTNDYLRDDITDEDQPFTAYSVIRQNARSNTYVLVYFHGSGGYVRQGGSDTQLNLNLASNIYVNNAAISEYGIITAVGNSTSSLLQWNEEDATVGDAGIRGLQFIGVGLNTNSAQFSAKLLIVRTGVDSEADRLVVIRKLNELYTIY
jgi:hypothetical protein